jgi:hypothetical protein
MVGKWRRIGGVERNGRTWLHLVLASTKLMLSRLENVVNQKFFRPPVRFDFLATGRENGGPTEVIDNHNCYVQVTIADPAWCRELNPNPRVKVVNFPIG